MHAYINTCVCAVQLLDTVQSHSAPLNSDSAASKNTSPIP